MNARDKPLVTIAIPTYNRADDYLKGALESALRQSYQPLEILVSDNCSTDATPDLVRSYDDPRLRYVSHEENLGAEGNFGYCVAEARGAFFLMLHDDDLIDDDMIETCMDAVDGRSDVGYVRTGNRLIDEDGDVTTRKPNLAAGTTGVDALIGWMQGKNYWALSSTLYETAALRAAGGLEQDDFALTVDCYATAHIAMHVGGIELKPVKASFRIHEGEMGENTDPAKWIDEWCRLHTVILEWASTPDERARLKKEGTKFFSRLSYQYVKRFETWTAFLKGYVGVAWHFGRFSPGVRERLERWAAPFFLWRTTLDTDAQ